jgi:hypothetical protein
MCNAQATAAGSQSQGSGDFKAYRMTTLLDIVAQLKKLLPLQIPPLDPGWATLLAGIFALIAGYLVYRAAMSSRNDARRRERDEERRRKLNLFLKAEHMAYILMQVAPLGLRAARLLFSKITVRRSKPARSRWCKSTTVKE